MYSLLWMLKKMGLCHNGMAQPLVVDEKDALQMPNKLSRTSEKGKPSRLQQKKKAWQGISYGQSLRNDISHG
jgi:hypothetical protein